MKRDLELVKKILLAIEAQEKPNPKFSIAGYDEEVVSYHIKLLRDAGLIEALVNEMMDWKIRAIPKRLTWEGHEWLDLARNDKVWTKAKKLVASKGLEIPFNILGLLLKELVKDLLNLPNRGT